MCNKKPTFQVIELIEFLLNIFSFLLLWLVTYFLDYNYTSSATMVNLALFAQKHWDNIIAEKILRIVS